MTPQWYAIQLEGTNTFGILDFSETEEGRCVFGSPTVSLILRNKELIRIVRLFLGSAEQASASRWQGSRAFIRESRRVLRSDARSRQGERNREPRALMLRR